MGLGVGDGKEGWEEDEFIFMFSNLILLFNNVYGNIMYMINFNNNIRFREG